MARNCLYIQREAFYHWYTNKDDELRFMKIFVGFTSEQTEVDLPWQFQKLKMNHFHLLKLKIYKLNLTKIVVFNVFSLDHEKKFWKLEANTGKYLHRSPIGM